MLALTWVLLLLLLMLWLRVPIALALLVSGTAGIVLLDGFPAAAATLANGPFNSVSSYALLIIPLFILMGSAAKHAHLAEDVYASLRDRIGWLPGGLGLTSLMSCAAFGAVSGSSIATVATMGNVSITEMVRAGYSKQLAAGITASGGTLGILIPPSIVIALYGMLTGESIAQLLIAALIPAALSIAASAGLIVYLVKRERKSSLPESGTDHEKGSPGVTATAGISEPDTYQPDGKVVARAPSSAASPTASQTTALASETLNPSEPVAERPNEFLTWVKVLALFSAVVGGMYLGLVTATEAAALGAFLATLMLIMTSIRRTTLSTIKSVHAAVLETASTSAMIFLLLVGGGVFTQYIVRSGIARDFSTWVTGLPFPGSSHLGV